MNYELLKEVSKGTALGLAIICLFAILHLPFPLLTLAPFFAGFIIGRAKRGVIAGFLTAFLPIMVILLLLIMALGSSNPNIPDSITLSGNPFGALAQVIVITILGASLVGIEVVLLIVFIILFIIGAIISLILSTILGALGGFIGGKVHAHRSIEKKPEEQSSYGSGGGPTSP